MQMQLHFPHVQFSGLNPPPPPHPVGREYLEEVSGTFPGNSAFRELPYGVLHCEDAVSIQLIVVLPWFGTFSRYYPHPPNHHHHIRAIGR